MINTAKIQSNVNDECYTPYAACAPLIKHLPSWVETVWCPCDKSESQIVKALIDAGYKVYASHIDDGYDFLSFKKNMPGLSMIDMIITNPPYSSKDSFIKQCIDLGKPWALLLPLDSLCGNGRYEQYARTDIGCITLHKRLDFTGKGRNWFYNAWVCSWPEMKNKWIQE